MSETLDPAHTFYSTDVAVLIDSYRYRRLGLFCFLFLLHPWQGATDREIKRQYRILSLKYHPDKEGGDPDMFMKIAKAHAA